MSAPHGLISKPIPQTYQKEGKTKYRWSGGRRGVPPWVIVLHYTAGYTEQHTYDVLVSRGLSVHHTLERDGVLYQHVGDDNRTYHAGYGVWGGVAGMNNHSLGVEIVNFGWAHGEYTGNMGVSTYKYDISKPSDPEKMKDPQGRRFYRKEKYGGKWWAITSEQTCEAFPDHRKEWQGKLWSTYTEQQIESIQWLCWQWVKKYDILLENIIGHEHVSPTRKSDPGPGFRPVWFRLAEYLEDWARKEKPELLDPKHRETERIKAVQSHLSRMGLYKMSIDGRWGSGSQNAVEEALDLFGVIYDFTYDTQDHDWLDIANCLRLVAGYDPEDLDVAHLSRLEDLLG